MTMTIFTDLGIRLRKRRRLSRLAKADATANKRRLSQLDRQEDQWERYVQHSERISSERRSELLNRRR